MGIEKANKHLDLVGEGLLEMQQALQSATTAMVQATEKMHQVTTVYKEAITSLIQEAIEDNLRSGTARIGAQVNPHYDRASLHIRQAGLVTIAAESDGHARQALTAFKEYGQRADEFNEILPVIGEYDQHVVSLRRQASSTAYHAHEAAWQVSGALGVDTTPVGLKAEVSNAIQTLEEYRNRLGGTP